MVNDPSTAWSPEQLLARAGRCARRFADPATWMAVIYVTAGVFTTLGLFIVALVLLVLSLPLVIIGVGIPIVVGALGVIVRMGTFERRRARQIGREIGPRSLSTGSMVARLRDPHRWRHVGFALSAWFVNLLAFAAMTAVWSTAIQLILVPIEGLTAGDTSWLRMLVSFPVGALLLLSAPWCTEQIAALLANYTGVVIGPDRVAGMQAQVTALTSSRDEILTAVASERQRIERNLHDGVQQQLVALGIDIGLARAKVEDDPQGALALLDEAREKTRASIGELRHIGQGLHPTVLADRGLAAALAAVASNASIPTTVRCELTSEPPPDVAEAVYFAATEAVTNAMKHSAARQVAVTAHSSPALLELWVYDDGRGGANTAGHGLSGIAARVRGLDGHFVVDSPRGGPTTVYAAIPLGPAPEVTE